MAYFCKAEGPFKSSCDLPMLYTHLRFSLVATLRLAYLNNAGALLNCSANTAGLSAFSCFVGVGFFCLPLNVCFPLLNLNLAPLSQIGTGS